MAWTKGEVQPGLVAKAQRPPLFMSMSNFKLLVHMHVLGMWVEVKDKPHKRGENMKLDTGGPDLSTVRPRC